MSAGWIGVDLDGTLAVYGEPLASGSIGRPVPEMLRRVRSWRREGIEVRVVTARAGLHPLLLEDFMREFREWSITNLGEVLPVTDRKDFAMVEPWDDRAVQVEPNTGRRIGE